MRLHAPRHGQATISLVLLIGGIASAVVIAIALIAISMVGTGFAADAAQRARAVAMAGIEDGALRLARSASDTGSYTVAAGSSTASVTIYPATPSAGFTSIYSQATVGIRRSRLYATYALDPATGIPTLITITPQ